MIFCEKTNLDYHTSRTVPSFQHPMRGFSYSSPCIGSSTYHLTRKGVVTSVSRLKELILRDVGDYPMRLTYSFRYAGAERCSISGRQALRVDFYADHRIQAIVYQGVFLLSIPGISISWHGGEPVPDKRKSIPKQPPLSSETDDLMQDRFSTDERGFQPGICLCLALCKRSSRYPFPSFDAGEMVCSNSAPSWWKCSLPQLRPCHTTLAGIPTFLPATISVRRSCAI